jgi:hypothetical protein
VVLEQPKKIVSNGGARSLLESVVRTATSSLSCRIPKVRLEAREKRRSVPQVKIEAVLHGGAVNLGDQAARSRQRHGIKPDAFADCR